MKRLHLLPVAVAVLAGCVENRTSVEITGRAAPSTTATATTGCQYTPGGVFEKDRGTLDVSFGLYSYGIALYFTNNVVDPKTLEGTDVTAAKAWRAESARVRINPPDYVDQFGASPALLSLTGLGATENIVPVAGASVPPGGDGVETFQAITPALGAKLKTALDTAASGVSPAPSRLIVLGITLRGKTGDGAEVDTAEFSFPVEVCDGCLQPAAAILDTTTTPVSCADKSKTLLSGNCFGFGQDSVPVCKAATAG